MSYNYAVPTSSALSPGKRPDRRLLAVLLIVPLMFSLATAWQFDHSFAGISLFGLTNLVGPTTESLMHGKGLAVCTDAMGTLDNPICFHSGRMPLPTLVVALGIRLFGDHFLPVGFFKVLLLVIPIEISIFFVWCRLPSDRPRRFLIALLLLVPFGITAFLADVVNLQVEEGYSYSFLALAVSILFFAQEKVRRSQQIALVHALLFALSADAIYLAKSSMAPAVLVLAIAFVFHERRTTLRLMVLLLIAAAPIGWAMYQHHASGRYALGTSIDGINLHKGNNAAFLSRYPPPPGDTLDQYDPELNAGHQFPNEWSFNDFHQRASLDFIQSHPGQALKADGRKLLVILFMTRKLGSAESHGRVLVLETIGLIVFRILFWTALVCATYGLLCSRRPGTSFRRSWTGSGAIFLFLVAACILPYLLGFAYTRHLSILIYPSVLMCCAVLVSPTHIPESSIAAL